MDRYEAEKERQKISRMNRQPVDVEPVLRAMRDTAINEMSKQGIPWYCMELCSKLEWLEKYMRAFFKEGQNAETSVVSDSSK